MNFFFLLLFFFLPLSADPIKAEQEEKFVFPLAPLAPLSQEFPLGMDQKSRMQIVQGSEILEKEKSHNLHLIQSHTFPWKGAWILLVLLSMGGFFYLHFKKRSAVASQKISPLSIEELASFSLKNKEEILVFYTALLTFFPSEKNGKKSAIQHLLDQKMSKIKYGNREIGSDEALKDYKEVKEWIKKTGEKPEK